MSSEKRFFIDKYKNRMAVLKDDILILVDFPALTENWLREIPRDEAVEISRVYTDRGQLTEYLREMESRLSKPVGRE